MILQMQIFHNNVEFRSDKIKWILAKMKFLKVFVNNNNELTVF